MDWLDTMDRALGRLIEAGRWLVLPVALILFLQWPLRDFVQWGSREANDLGQWIFALYVAACFTSASIEIPSPGAIAPPTYSPRAVT